MGRGASWVAPTELRARFRDGLHRLSDLRNEESQQTAGNSGTQK
jgi:hypothetical protein